MIQCIDCELFELGAGGERIFKCDPFVNIKEPECLLKWQLMRLDALVTGHENMSKWQNQFGPLQDKLFKYMEREIDQIDESDQWRLDEDDDEDENFGPGEVF